MAGRPERALDPAGGALQQLAHELRRLRVEAGSPTYREMARRSGCGASTLSQAAAGERLPSPATLRAYVEACGGDTAQWEKRWLAAAGRPEQDGPAEPPYRGLARYEPADRELYFGRDDLVVQLTARVRAHRLVAVVGASGSGKSSLLRAGLIPALRAEPRTGCRPAVIRVLTPGPRPATAHTALLEAARGGGNSGGNSGGDSEAGGDTVVVVDQFEELFTLGAGTAERAAFIGRLLAAADPAARLRVVLAVRADFFGRVAEHPALADAVRDATVLVAPMGPEALREAVVGPAAAAGLIVERSLTARIVREAGEQPGGLPLMSHALLETWRRRRGRVLTEEMYEAAGGLRGAIAATAESVHARLTPAQAAGARRILLRMVAPGTGAADTLRPVARAELAELGETAGGAGEVLEQLVAARLLTADGDTLRLAHEALLDAWPRYRGWIEEDRERLSVHRGLTEAARAWHELDRDAGALYRGVRLSSAEAAFRPAGQRASLTRLETSFLDAGIRAREHEALASTRAACRLRRLTTALALLLVLAAVTSGVGWQQNRAEQLAKSRAVAAQRESLSRRLAAEADHLGDTDAELSMLLAVRAYRTSRTPDAYASLLRAAAVPLDRRLVPPGGAVAGPVGALAFSHDGRSLLWGVGDGGVLRTDVGSGRTASLSGAGEQPVAALAFTPGDRRTVLGYPSAVVRTADADGRVAGPAVSGPDAPRSVAARLPATGGPGLDAAGAEAAATAPGGGVMLRDTATGRARDLLPAPYVFLGLSPDGRTLAARDGDRVSVWDTATGARRTVLPGACSCGTAVFSRDGRRLAVDAAPGITVWDLDALRSWPLNVTADMTEKIGPFAFGPDGAGLIVGYDDAAVRVFDIAEGRSTAALEGLSSGVTRLALSADGRELAVGLSDGVVALYDTTGALLPRRLSRPGAQPAATGSLFLAGRTATGTRVTTGMGFTADGTALLTGTADGSLDRWTVASGRWSGTRTAPPVPGAPAGEPGGTAASVPGVTVGESGGTAPPVPGAPAGEPGGTAASVPGAPAGESGGTVPSVPAVTAGEFGGTAPPVPGAPAGEPGGSGPPAQRLLPDRDGGTVALLGYDGTVRLWRGTTGPARDIGSPTAAAALSPDGRTLITAGTGGTLMRWSTATGRPASPQVLHTALTAAPVTLVFSPDGTGIAVDDSSGAVTLLDAATGATRQRFTSGEAYLPPREQPNGTLVAFAPDGRTLATAAGNGTVFLWDPATGGLRASLRGGAPVTSLAFSPDGGTVATGGADGTVRLRDVTTHQVRNTLIAGFTPTTSVAFGPDGHTLATATLDGTTRLFHLRLPADPAAAALSICTALSRDLTPQERAGYLPPGPVGAGCRSASSGT